MTGTKLVQVQTDTSSVLRRTTVSAAVKVVCSRCDVWLRSCTVSQCFHLYMVCPVVPNRAAKADAGATLAWIAARTSGVAVAC